MNVGQGLNNLEPAIVLTEHPSYYNNSKQTTPSWYI